MLSCFVQGKFWLLKAKAKSAKPVKYKNHRHAYYGGKMILPTRKPTVVKPVSEYGDDYTDDSAEWSEKLVDFKCTAVGYFAKPGKCNEFYKCKQKTGSNKFEISRPYRCPKQNFFYYQVHYYFDSASQKCLHEDFVDCPKGWGKFPDGPYTYYQLKINDPIVVKSKGKPKKNKSNPDTKSNPSSSEDPATVTPSLAPNVNAEPDLDDSDITTTILPEEITEPENVEVSTQDLNIDATIPVTTVNTLNLEIEETTLLPEVTEESTLPSNMETTQPDEETGTTGNADHSSAAVVPAETTTAAAMEPLETTLADFDAPTTTEPELTDSHTSLTTEADHSSNDEVSTEISTAAAIEPSETTQTTLADFVAPSTAES